LNRRPLRTRQRAWAIAIARWLVEARVTPNTISLLSVLFAAMTGACLLLQAGSGLALRIILLVTAAVFIQLRLLCNMLDGMVAIEGGLKTPTGDIFNDFPDRISDIVTLVCAGYAISGVSWGAGLGWVAALLAVLTAYVRLLGGSLGLPQDFSGPMAKPHRMALMTAACLLQAALASIDQGGLVMTVALLLVAGGSLVTVWRRTSRIAVALRSR
jgi:phosphatidylglycerophosphate synthase